MDLQSNTPHVAMNYRFAAAWNEVNARIAQRQNALNIFITLATGIVTLLVAGSLDPTENAVPGLHRIRLINPELFAVMLPLVSLSFGFLNYKHDKTIALLRKYLSECEKLNNADARLLGYNSSEFYAGHAERTRVMHDIACALIVVIYNGLGFWAARRAYPQVFTLTGWPLVAYVAAGVGTLVLVTRSTIQGHTFGVSSAKASAASKP